jgi:hypothetical protein
MSLCDTLSPFLPPSKHECRGTPGISYHFFHFLNPKQKEKFFMVTVTNYRTCTNKEGESFIVLTLTSGVEIIQSQLTGQFRAVVRKCQIPASFDESVAKMVIGTQLPGEVVRVQSKPYPYTDKKSGEVLTLSHKWSYLPENATIPVSIEETEEEMVA